jgi:hypothetical protein
MNRRRLALGAVLAALGLLSGCANSRNGCDSGCGNGFSFSGLFSRMRGRNGCECCTMEACGPCGVPCAMPCSNGGCGPCNGLGADFGGVPLNGGFPGVADGPLLGEPPAAGIPPGAVMPPMTLPPGATTPQTAPPPLAPVPGSPYATPTPADPTARVRRR